LNGKIDRVYREENIIDQNELPTYQLYIYANWAVILDPDHPERGWQLKLIWYITCASDLPYSCLDGEAMSVHDKNPWIKAAKSGDPFHPPVPDSFNDLLSEVYVGRAPVSDSYDLENFVKKTISYMQSSDDDYNKVLMIGEKLGFGGVMEYAKDSLNELIGNCNNHGYFTHGIPTSQYDIDNLYEKNNFWIGNQLVSNLNGGNINLVNHLGHSNIQFNMKLHVPINDLVKEYRQRREYINGDYSLYNNLLNNNQYFIVYSQGCFAGAFDSGGSFQPEPWSGSPLDHYGDCIAEYLTVKNPYGAVAGIWNSHYGWGRRETTRGPSQYYHREFIDALFGEQKPLIGMANQDSKEDNINRFDCNQMLWLYYCLNLIGDPALRVHGAPGTFEQPPILEISSDSYDFGEIDIGYSENTMFELWNSGDETLTYSLLEDCSWLSVSPSSGLSNGEHDQITISVDTDNLDPGFYSYDIKIETNGGNEIFTVSLVAKEIHKKPTFKISPNHFDFGEIFVSGHKSTNFEIWNSGTGILSYLIEEDCSWLSVSPSSGSSTGEHDLITVSVDTGELNPGDYFYSLEIVSNGGNELFNVSLKVIEIPNVPYLRVNTQLIDFGEILINTQNYADLELWNGGTGILSYLIEEDCSWLSVSPSSGSSTGEHDIITLSIDNLGLTEGFYEYDFTISSNDVDKEITVKMKIIKNSSKPTLEILKPKKSMLYLFDKEIISLSRTLIFGPITFKVDAQDSDGYITKVEFYLDNNLKNTTFEKPYQYLMDEKAIGFHNLTIKVYDNSAQITQKSIEFLIFNFRFSSTNN
jgi:hypothetical protein